MKKRLLSALLTFCMLLTLLPVSALAVEPYERGHGGGQDNNKSYGVRIDLAGTTGFGWDKKTVVEEGNTVTVTLSNDTSEFPTVHKEEGDWFESDTLYVYLSNVVSHSDQKLTATVTTNSGYTATVDLAKPYSYSNRNNYYYGNVESRDWTWNSGGDWGDNARVTYVSNWDGDAGTRNEDIEYRNSATVIQNPFEPPAAYDYCDPNVFVGWNTEWDGSGTDYEPGDTIEIPDDGITLYAQWNRAVKFFVFKGNRTPSENVDTAAGNYFPNSDDDGGVRDANTNTGFQSGYLTQAGYAALKASGQHDASDPPVQMLFDTTRNALNSYLITNNLDLGRFDDDLKTPVSWYVIKEQSDGIHCDGYVTNIAIDIIYHANFNGDGGESTYTQEALSGYEVSIPDYGETKLPARSGYSFLGWSTSRDGNVVYAPEDEVIFTGGQNLYAVWEENTVTINYEALEGGSVSPKSETVGVNDSPEGSTATAEDGWHFAGWYDNKDCNGNPVGTDEKFVPKTTSAATYYAKFERNQTLDIVITGDVEEVTYDGQSHTAESYTVTYNGGNEAPVGVTVTLKEDVTASVTGTNVSDSRAMGLTEDSFTVTAPGYTVNLTVTDGSLTITPKDVTIIAASDSKPYDGTELTNGNYAVVEGDVEIAPPGTEYSNTGKAIIAGELITATVTGSQTNVGTSANVPSNATVTNGNASNYTFHYVNGTLTVNKASVTITVMGNTATETYDNTEKTVEGFAVTGNPTDTTVELAVGETAKATGVNVNTYYMGLDENSFVLEGDTAENYAVTWDVTDGWLQIIDNATLTVSAPNVTTTYDGAAHPVTPTASVPGATITVTYTDADGNTITGEPIDAGTYTAAITATLSGYETATSTATVTINPATLTVTTPNASKVYDGTPLTAAGNATENLVGLVNGETVTFTVTGSQTEIGNSKNTYSLVWDGTANQSNYTIVENLGTLTVTPATGVTVAKEATAAPVGGYVAGDTITWTITVTNIGTETVHGLSLADSIQDVVLSGPDGVNPADFDLDPNESVEFTATLANAPAGTYTNYVTVSQNGTDLGNAPADPVIVTGQAPHLTVSKEADKDTAQVGDTVNYTITVANTGNVPLNNVTVTDTFTGAGVLTFTDSTAYTVNNNGDGTYTITIGNMAKGASVTITATYIVLEADASNNTITNTAAANADGLDDTPPATETVTVSGQFTLIYNANGGSFDNEEETFTVPNLSGGTYTLTDTQGYNEPTNGNYVFIGWSETQPETAIGAGEEIPDCITEVTLDDTTPSKTVYAVWGEDANDDNVADAQQIVIRPADITIYTGGDGYEGVVEGSNGAMTGSSTSHGLPEPGYYLVLPYDLNEDLREDLGVTGTVDLSQHLRFTYGADRIWELELYNPNSYSMAYDYYIYQMVPQVAGQDPVRLEIKDGDTYVTDDDFTIALDTLYQEYEMKLYTGEVEASGITVQISVDGENWADVGRDEADGICTIVGTLTVRGTNSNDPTTSIESSVTSPVDVITAETGDVTYYINDSDIPVVNQDDVALLSDELVGAGVSTLLDEAEDRLGLAWYEDYEYQTQYLDLVDTSNGNAYVTLGEGDSVDIHWPMPNGTSRWNTEFYVVHFDGLDRNFDDLDAQLDSGNVDLQVYTLGNGLRIENGNLVFTTDTFSPFVLIWQDSDRDWPDDDDDDDNDRPSHDDDDDNDRPEQEDPAPELDKESHIAYVSGTPEGTIEPNAYITREEVATIFFRLLTDRSRANYITDYNPFPDVDSSRWSFYPIVTMNNAGIMHGYDDGNFAPSGYITRAEFAVVAAQFSDAEYTGADLFSDISGHWAREYINRAASEGWISGYPDGSFGPDDYITRAQVMALVNEVLDRAPDADYMLDDMITWPDNADESAWYYEDVQEATNSHSYVWRNSGRTSEEWEDLIDTRTLDELVRDAFNGVGISY